MNKVTDLGCAKCNVSKSLDWGWDWRVFMWFNLNVLALKTGFYVSVEEELHVTKFGGHEPEQ